MVHGNCWYKTFKCLILAEHTVTWLNMAWSTLCRIIPGSVILMQKATKFLSFVALTKVKVSLGRFSVPLKVTSFNCHERITVINMRIA